LGQPKGKRDPNRQADQGRITLGEGLARQKARNMEEDKKKKKMEGVTTQRGGENEESISKIKWPVFNNCQQRGVSYTKNDGSEGKD